MSTAPEGAALPSAVRLECDAATPAGDALAEILRELSERIERNHRRVVASADPGALHDFRVAMRRTRSALAEVKRVLDKETRRALARGLAELGSATGPLRDLDVLAESIEREAQRSVAEGEPWTRLLDRIADRASAARRELLGAVDGPATGETVAALRRVEPAGRHADRPVREVALTTLQRAWKRFVAAGDEALASEDDEQIHRLRIRGKRLRYALEFFGGVVDPSDHPVPPVEELKSYQDLLGAHNDLANQLPMLRALRASSATDPDLVALLDRLVDRWTTRLEESRAEILAGWPIVDSGSDAARGH